MNKTNTLSTLAPIGCTYSVVCLLAWDLYWWFNMPGNPAGDLSSVFGEKVFGGRVIRFDHWVSRTAAVAFATCCLAQSLRHGYCAQQGISSLSVCCNEYINLLALTSHLLMCADVLPHKITLHNRLTYTARLGEWVAVIPLLTLMVISFDIRLKRDWARLFAYAATLQLATVTGAIACLTISADRYNVFMSTSIISFAPLYILPIEAYFRCVEQTKYFESLKPSDPAYLTENLVRIGTVKALYAALLLTIFLTYVVAVHFISADHRMSHKTEYALQTIGDTFIKLLFVYMLTSEHIRLILEEKLLNTWRGIRDYFNNQRDIETIDSESEEFHAVKRDVKVTDNRGSPKLQDVPESATKIAKMD